MRLLLVGISHRTAPVELRERLDFQARGSFGESAQLGLPGAGSDADGDCRGDGTAEKEESEQALTGQGREPHDGQARLSLSRPRGIRPRALRGEEQCEDDRQNNHRCRRQRSVPLRAGEWGRAIGG